MSKAAHKEAEELLSKEGPQALEHAEREYSTALETQDIKQQGYWLEVIEELKSRHIQSI